MKARLLGGLLSLVLVFAAVSVLGCTEKSTTTTSAVATTSESDVTAPASTETTAVPAAEVKVTQWDIPFLVFLSGPYGGFGEQMKWSVGQAVKAINDAGGIAGKPVNVTYQDTGLDPAKASAEMSKVVEKSLTVMGPVAAVEAKAAMPLAVQKEMMVMSVATGTDITKEFAPYLVSFIAPTEVAVPPAVEEWVKQNPGIKTVAQFTWPLDPTWMQMAAVHTTTLTKLGIKSTDVAVGQGVDMGAVAVKALGLKPDAYIITVGPVEAGKIVQELDKRGVTDHSKILIFMTADDPALYETGGAALNGAYIYNPLDQHNSNPRWQALLQAYQQETGIKRGGMALTFFYDALYMIKDAIEKTGVTGDAGKLPEERAKIRDYVQNVTGFEGLTGTWDVVKGYGYPPMYLFTIQDGDTTVVKEFQLQPAQ